MREPVFLDTAGLIAAIRSADVRHPSAVIALQQFEQAARPLVTTDWVLTEFLAGASSVKLRALAITTTDRLFASRSVRVLPATRRSWLSGFDLYRSRHDKEWSLVDCVSILVCQARGIRHVFTSDTHFTQAGLKALLA